ncbi:MAG: bifunctional phosphoribosyl-AMP cyclohydrolase/phosphoribosyl-ATP diphosphatase HisIE [Eubacteriales bacterium]
MTEKNIETLEKLKFDSNGLIPAVLLDVSTGSVLMLAYMNRESYLKTLGTGLACFYSRERGKLWTKGETSGNFMRVESIAADCDFDALLIGVRPDGPACHTGKESCFFNDIKKSFSLSGLYEIIKDRKTHPAQGSYTSYLFEKGLDKILKKVGEETAEVIIGVKNSREEGIYEIADLCYHVLALMVEAGITPDEVLTELKGRHVVDKKTKQEKMK